MPNRADEIRELLEVMKASGVSSLKVGDIELTMAPTAPEEDGGKPRYVSPEEAEAKARATRRSLMLSAGSRIVGRAGE